MIEIGIVDETRYPGPELVGPLSLLMSGVELIGHSEWSRRSPFTTSYGLEVISPKHRITGVNIT